MDKTELAGLRWRCRRGMRELDMLCDRYYEQRLPHAPEDEVRAFAELLSCEDDLIWDWISGREEPSEQRIADVISWMQRTGNH